MRLDDGRVLVTGGARMAEMFDPATGSFAPVAGSGSADFSFAVAVRLDDGSVLVCGGYDSGIALTEQVLRFEP